jgi:hypothetical protein
MYSYIHDKSVKQLFVNNDNNAIVDIRSVCEDDNVLLPPPKANSLCPCKCYYHFRPVCF